MRYWIATGAVCLFLLLSAGSYLLHQATIDGIRDLGFPDFFRVELAVLKIFAVVALALPFVPSYAKEWAYAGVVLFLLTAVIAHQAHGDSAVLHLVNLAVLLALVVPSGLVNG